MKEILLSVAIALGAGAATETPAPSVIDIPTFLRLTGEDINTDSNPDFFKTMDDRANHNPGEYFQQTPLNGGELILYYPEGFKSTPRVGVRKTVTNSQNNGMTVIQTDEAVILDIEQDGGLGTNATVDLLNPTEIKTACETYLVEPDAVKGIDWNIVDADPTNPAKVSKLNAADPNDVTYYGGDQHGFIVREHYTSVQTPIVPSNQG